MKYVEVLLPGYECLECKHRWKPRVPGEPPLKCPRCQAQFAEWNRPQRQPA